MPMSGKDMVRLLMENGWVIVRINGSHHILAKDGAPRTISVPVHAGKVLGKGLENSILKQAGLK